MKLRHKPNKASKAIETLAPDASPNPPPAGLHWPSLLLGLAIMLAGTLYPLLFADASGQADHRLATLIFWAMSAGLIRGVGYIPAHWLWRWLFSAAAAFSALGLALLWRFYGSA